MPVTTRPCKHCQTPFQAWGKILYCSDRCRKEVKQERDREYRRNMSSPKRSRKPEPAPQPKVASPPLTVSMADFLHATDTTSDVWGVLPTEQITVYPDGSFLLQEGIKMISRKVGDYEALVQYLQRQEVPPPPSASSILESHIWPGQDVEEAAVEETDVEETDVEEAAVEEAASPLSLEQQIIENTLTALRRRWERDVKEDRFHSVDILLVYSMVQIEDLLGETPPGTEEAAHLEHRLECIRQAVATFQPDSVNAVVTHTLTH